MSFFKGLLQDEEFLVAAGLLQQGSQGKGIGEAIFPAIAQAGQVKKLFGEKKKRATVKGADGYIDLELITTAANNLETGKAAPLLADLMKWGQSFGIDVSWLSDLGDMNTQIANTEVINVLSGNQLFGKIQQTGQ